MGRRDGHPQGLVRVKVFILLVFFRLPELRSQSEVGSDSALLD